MNILLADDDRNFGLALKKEKELEEDRHLVDFVANGVEPVLRFINNTYDFVLLDPRMPRLGGTDTLRIIKNINPDVPTITFSGNAGTAEIEESARCVATKCLKKPFNAAQLREEIKDPLLR